ncbi:MAG TPA: hypothetical protein VLD67_15255 [Vicinamibacterales bacterium]|nr:hypothetical protein [Vicinamibacterales bacterium]
MGVFSGAGSRRAGAALLVIAVAAMLSPACGGGRFFGKVYEYEEDLYLALDGSADLIVNTSIPALVALRGLDLNVDPAARVDRGAIRAAYEGPGVTVTRVSRPWRRQGRRFVQLRIDVEDVRRLSERAPFSWSTYELFRQDQAYVFRQTVGASAHRPGTLRNVGWTGGELVAFRLHLPSRIIHHNARDAELDEPLTVERGNILRWEQQLADRLDGRPVAIEVRMESQSTLHRTLGLFLGAFAAALLLLGLIIWLTLRKGARQTAAESPPR